MFAMLASYLLSRTLIPTLAKFWLKKKDDDLGRRRAALARFQEGFEHGFERVRDGYRELLEPGDRRRPARSRRCSCSPWRRPRSWHFRWVRCPGWARTSFRPWMPASSSCTCGRAPERASRTRRCCAIRWRKLIRETMRPGEITSIVDNLGLPYSGINLAYSTSAPVGPGDADIFINLAKKHHSLDDYQRELRSELGGLVSLDSIPVPAGRHRQPDPEFRPSLAVGRAGRRGRTSRRIASSSKSLLRKLTGIAGAVDLHIQQPYDYPQINVDVDRTQGAVSRPHRTEHRLQHAHFAIRKLSDHVRPSGSTRSPARSTTSSRRRRNIRLTSLNDLGNTPLSQTVGHRSGRRRHLANPLERGDHASQRGPRRRQPLQRPGRLRYLRQRAGHRPGLRRRAVQQGASMRPGRICPRGRPSTSRARSRPCSSRSAVCCSGWSAPSFWSTCSSS